MEQFDLNVGVCWCVHLQAKTRDVSISWTHKTETQRNVGLWSSKCIAFLHESNQTVHHQHHGGATRTASKSNCIEKAAFAHHFLSLAAAGTFGHAHGLLDASEKELLAVLFTETFINTFLLSVLMFVS